MLRSNRTFRCDSGVHLREQLVEQQAAARTETNEKEDQLLGYQQDAGLLQAAAVQLRGRRVFRVGPPVREGQDHSLRQ